MATTPVAEPAPEVLPWLKNLPLAPEYHPTPAEFQDPISYIFKIEKEASRYGICKIVPPVPPNSKKTAISNLNRSLAERSVDSSPKSSKPSPTFTTRQQQIGFCPRRHRPVQKPVWQSGDQYTFHEFEAKAKIFERNYLKRCAKKSLSSLETETLFWKACVDKPFSVEYANDMPGSAFAPINERKLREAGDAANVGETAWNMRGVSRAKGSLLRFMKEEIPGVTSPMVYVAMMFSWFAWHVEDHDLHSLNYLHMGAGKTWYGVPRDAAVAFEEVVRVHGYGGEINPLVTFAILGEKTTVMSPEVFLSAGIPCCRLVQNAGEFVVTFPRAYHCGFSHGFNCGEAANIATPEWLRVAKDAAIRRASINYPPMVSHIQLLYDLALALCSSVPMSVNEPRSSRLKDKKKGEGETLVKELFVKNVIQNNDLLHILGKGSPVVLFPQNSPDISIRSKSHVKFKSRLSLGLCSPEEGITASKSSVSDDITVNKNQGVIQSKGRYPMKGKLPARNRLPSFVNDDDDGCTFASPTHNSDMKKENGDGLQEHGHFSCVTCGILSFACYALVQPKEAAARYLMSADCSFFNDWIVSAGVTRDGFATVSEDANASQINSSSGLTGQSIPDGLYDVPIQSGNYQIQATDQVIVPVSNTETQERTSALGLLALNYGNSSDSDEAQIEADAEVNSGDSSPESISQYNCSGSPPPEKDSQTTANRGTSPHEIIDPYWGRGPNNANSRVRNQKMFSYSDDFEAENLGSVELNSPEGRTRDSVTISDIPSSFSPVPYTDERSKFTSAVGSLEKAIIPFPPRSDEDSSRVHVFCLEHAVEVEQQLRPIGGAYILLLCSPDYPKVEVEARLLAEELGIGYTWNDIAFRDATKEDSERIQSALDGEDVVPGNGDWAVKLGINLYYSAILSRSPLYSKQMPYNSVMYDAFGRTSPGSSPSKFNEGKASGKQKKIVTAGKWCGKVWMSNQVHPFLVPRDPDGENPDERPERRYNKSTCKADTATESRKSGRKRKMAMEDQPTKKAKSPPLKDLAITSHDSRDGSYQKNKRILRSRPVKQETPPLKHEHGKSSGKFHSSFDEDLEGGPSTRLRKRTPRPSKDESGSKSKAALLKQQNGKKMAAKSAGPKTRVANKNAKPKDEEEEYQCDMEGCAMSFGSKHELTLHKRNVCPVKGCGKKFFSHKYLLQHRRVHVDDRPLKCPWRGCKMTFKWAWARTEHIRVHTGARPYVCSEAGCGQTFRFVSDFSRHKRKTGHSAKKVRR